MKTKETLKAFLISALKENGQEALIENIEEMSEEQIEDGLWMIEQRKNSN